MDKASAVSILFSISSCVSLIFLAFSSCHSRYREKSSNITFGFKLPEVAEEEDGFRTRMSVRLLSASELAADWPLNSGGAMVRDLMRWRRGSPSPASRRPSDTVVISSAHGGRRCCCGLERIDSEAPM